MLKIIKYNSIRNVIFKNRLHELSKPMTRNNFSLGEFFLQKRKLILKERLYQSSNVISKWNTLLAYSKFQNKQHMSQGNDGTRVKLVNAKDKNRNIDISSVCNKNNSLDNPAEVNTNISPQHIMTIPEKPTSQELPSPIKRYFIGRFSTYLNKFQKSLANEMPDTFHMFRTFSSGIKEFVIDFRDYIKVVMKLSLSFYDLEDLSYRELYLYNNMPMQMLKVSPVLIISSLPFAQNIALPIAYVFPKQLLSYQFWDAQQRHEFSVYFLTKRLYNARPVFRCLQARVEDIKNTELKQRCQKVFYSLGSGIHPTMENIENIKEVFSKDPFDITSIGSRHVKCLLRLHNKSVWSLRRRKKLLDHARILRCMDNVLNQDGISSLTEEQIHNALFFRGVNPTGMKSNECTEYLENWMKLSTELNSSNSLLLHLPILLAYNHPTNLVLIL